MGFRIVLYISNLFSSNSFDFLPMIRYMRRSYNPTCFILVSMCFCHASLQSRWKPGRDLNAGERFKYRNGQELTTDANSPVRKSVAYERCECGCTETVLF